MQKDSNLIGDQFLLNLGSLTQSVPTNISAMSSCSTGQQFPNHSINFLKVQSLEATSPTAVGFESQSQNNTDAVIKSGELKSIMSSDNLLSLAQTISQLPQAPAQAPFTLTSSTSVTINSMSTQAQSLTTQTPNSMLYTYFNCKHQTIVTYSKCQFCKECGVRMYKDSQFLALKSYQMNYKLNTNPLRLYSNTYKQKKQKTSINLSEHSDYLKQRERTINYVTDLADRMRLTKQSAFLSIMFLDYLVVNDINSELCSLKIKEHLQLFGAVCVMLGAKSIELDERIPFLSSLKKYMCLNQYSKEDLRKAEQKTVQILKFNMQIPTLYDLLEYYGSQGVVFSNDLQKGAAYTPIISPTPFLSNETKNTSAKKERSGNNRTIELEFQGTAPSSLVQNNQLQSEDSTKNSSPNLNDYSSSQETSSKNSNSDEANASCSPPPHSKVVVEPQPPIIKEYDISPIKLYDIVSKIEKDLSRIAFLAIKDDKFYEYDLEILGAACICYLREKQNISNPYRDEILQLCNQDRAQVLSCCLQFLSKFDTYFKPHSYLNGSTSSGISPLKDIKTNLKLGFYTSDNYKSASNLSSITTTATTTTTTTTTTRILQENKKPLFDNFDLNSYRIREKSFEKIGVSYQSQRTSIGSQHLSKNTISGLQNNRNNFFEYNKLNDQKVNNLSSITNISTSNASSASQSTINNGTTSSNSIHQSSSITSTSSNIGSLQSKLLQQQNAFSSGSFYPMSTSSNSLSSGLSSISSYQKPYQLALNQYSSKPLLSTASTTLNSKIPTSIPNFDDEAKWNSHFTKTINQINFRASSFNSNSFLRRNKF